jgi:hypothetical protein
MRKDTKLILLKSILQALSYRSRKKMDMAGEPEDTVLQNILRAD